MRHGDYSSMYPYMRFRYYPVPVLPKIGIPHKIENINATQAKIKIDLKKLSSGIYIIKAKNDKGITIKKFMKQ